MTDIAHMIRSWPQGEVAGVPFHVESASTTIKQRMVQHKAPGVDGAILETLGLEPDDLSFNAYVVSDKAQYADQRRDALIKVMKSKRVVQLKHPTLNKRFSVKLESLTVSENADRLGYIGLSLKFVQASKRSTMISGPIRFMTAQLSAEALPAIVYNQAADFSARGYPDYVQESVAFVLEELAAWAQSVLSRGWLEASAIAPINRDSLDLDADAVALAVAPQQGLERSQNLMTLVQGGLKSPADGQRLFAELLDVEQSSALSGVSGLSPNRQAAVKLASLWQLARATQACSSWLLAVLAGDYASRTAALEAAAMVARRSQALINAWYDQAYLEQARALEKARLEAVEDLRQRAETLRPVISYSTAKPLPSSLVTWQLYGSLERRDDVVARNAALHPLFMPQDLEVLAEDLI